jgi:hypothetical protein
LWLLTSPGNPNDEDDKTDNWDDHEEAVGGLVCHCAVSWSVEGSSVGRCELELGWVRRMTVESVYEERKPSTSGRALRDLNTILHTMTP